MSDSAKEKFPKFKAFGRALVARPIENLGGTGLVVFGTVIAAVGVPEELQWVNGMGTAALVLGGALLSSSISRSYAEQLAELQTRAEIGVLSDGVGNAAGEIQQALFARVRGEFTEATLHVSIGQALRSLYQNVTSMRRFAGSDHADKDGLIETAEELNDITKQLVALTSSPAVEGARGELEALRGKLEGVVSTLKADSTTETLRCPQCNQENSITIGVLPGTTRTANCVRCARRLNFHRAANGVVFLGGQNASIAPLVKISCPHCSDQVEARIDSKSPLIRRWCFKCGWKQWIERTSGKVVNVEEDHFRDTAPIGPPVEDRVLLVCGGCKETVRSLPFG